MSDSEREFDRKHQRNVKKLDKLEEELDQLDLTPLSEQVRKALSRRVVFQLLVSPKPQLDLANTSVSADLWRRS